MGHFWKFFNILTFLTIIINQGLITSVSGNIDCGFFQKAENELESWSRKIYRIFSRKIHEDNINVTFWLSTKSHVDPIEVGPNKWSNLQNHLFDVNKKTIVIIHGWKSSSLKPWVHEMTKTIHSIKDVNIIIVDWSTPAVSWNYFAVAKIVPDVANLVADFFKALRTEIKQELVVYTNEPHFALHEFAQNEIQDFSWNHLYFIGHSLGAHVSGHAAHLLKESDDSFWQVERISGLDPALPCFEKASKTADKHRLDKSDAAFVDIIHSSAKPNSTSYAFGIHESIGHIDFYIDGGAQQPKCNNWNPMESHICSHQFSYKLFIQSLAATEDCKLYGHSWNGDVEKALEFLAEQIKNKEITCIDCPEIGINAIESSKRGSFLALTSEVKPTCPEYDDPKSVKESIVR